MSREGVQLQCSVCKEINYITKRDKKKKPDKLELKKFCSKCRKTTIHKETKK